MGWTQIGENVVIDNGQVEYRNGAADAEQRRVYRELDFSIESEDCWRASLVFVPQELGILGGQPMTGHAILALSETSQDPTNDCSSVACPGYPLSVQDALRISYLSNNPPDGSIFFVIQFENGPVRMQSKELFYDKIGEPIFVELSRQCGLLELNVYEDSEFKNPLGSGPVTLEMAAFKPLKFLQIGNITEGRSERELTGTVDDVCIELSDSCFTIDFNLDTTLCLGEELSFRDTIFQLPGEYQYTISGVGCDTVYSISFAHKPEAILIVDTIVCASETLIFGNETFDSNNPSGTVIIPSGSSMGCDSTIEVN